ncbi:hypothetical protein ABK046_51930, partial [Streptomyces caeruleatus]
NDEFGQVIDKGVTAVRHSDAGEAWHRPLNEQVRAGMAAANGVLWVHTSADASIRTTSLVIALDAVSGAPLTTHQVPDTS